MADVEYMLPCDYAFPAEGGKACIIGVFKNINAAAFPATHPLMAVAIQLTGEPFEIIPIRITLTAPNDEVVFRADGQATASNDGGAFVNVTLVGTVFPAPGEYFVAISSGDTVLARRSFWLRQVAATEARN